MASRRKNHEGSVFQRSDGRWVATISNQGQRHFRYGGTVWEALEHLETLKSSIWPNAQSPASTITLGEWIARWLAEISPDIRPSTHNTYEYTLRPISREIGQVVLSELTPLLLTDAFTRIRESGKGARQVNLAHGYLKTCLKHAVSLDVLDRNPMEKVRRPKWVPQKRTYWDMDQVKRFLEEGLRGTRYYDPLLVFLCVSGLRISEAIALRWDDLNSDRQSISVERAIVWHGNKYDELPPKSEAGNRTVSLPRVAIEALEIVRGRDMCLEGSRIFQTKYSSPPRHSDLRKAVGSLCQRANVPMVNVHGLRHVAAMLALQAVDDPYLVQRRLGHSHISVTLGIYGYTSRDESSVGTQLDEMLGDGYDTSPSFGTE